MAGVPLTGSQGLFTRLGTFAELLNSINSQRGTTIPADVTAINNQYVSTDQDVIDNLYTSLLSYQNACSSFNSSIRSMCSNTVISMVNDVAPLQNQTLSTALQSVIAQMVAQSQTVNQCTLSSSVFELPSNIGNPNVVISLHDVNNLLVENCFAETATATVTQDGQTSPSLVGREQISLQSQYSINDTFSWLYPVGSGTSLSIQAVSGMQSNGGGTSNWLNNGSFESWSPTGSLGVPVGWTVETGVPGTTILQSNSIFYDGMASLQFLSNGSENTAIYQNFSTPSSRNSTTAQIFPNQIFAWNCWMRVSGTPGSGILRIALTNGSTVIDDNSGAPNSLSVNLNTLTTSWVPISGFFRTPNQNPSILWLEIKILTPMPSTFSVYIDRFSWTNPTRWYAGGEFIAVFSGNVNLIRNDSFICTINNNYGGLFQNWFQKVFNMNSLGLILPSSVSPTIPDY